MSSDLYAESILDEFRHPQNNVELVDFDIAHDATNSSCGDSFKIWLKLDASQKKIQQIGWKGTGCAISTAALSRVSALATGQNVSQVLSWDKNTLLQLLGLPDISIGRERCLLIGLVGIQSALQTILRTMAKTTA